MDEFGWIKEFENYDFCLIENGKVTHPEMIFEDPEEMFAFMKVCWRNGIEFSVNKYHEPVPVTEDAEE